MFRCSLTLLDNSAIDTTQAIEPLLLHDISLYEHTKRLGVDGIKFLEKVEAKFSKTPNLFHISLPDADVMRLEIDRGKPAHTLVNNRLTLEFRELIKAGRFRDCTFKETLADETSLVKENVEAQIVLTKKRLADLDSDLNKAMKALGKRKSDFSSELIAQVLVRHLDPVFHKVCLNLMSHGKKADELFRQRHDSFLYRGMLVDYVLLAQLWKSEETDLGAGFDKVHNMMIDNRYIAMATFCRGFSSNDARQKVRFQLVQDVLSAMKSSSANLIRAGRLRSF